MPSSTALRFLIGSVAAVGVIFATHFIIDRFRLVRYLIWAKNCLAASHHPWAECAETAFTRAPPNGWPSAT